MNWQLHRPIQRRMIKEMSVDDRAAYLARAAHLSGCITRDIVEFRSGWLPDPRADVAFPIMSADDIAEALAEGMPEALAERIPDMFPDP